MNAQQQIKRGQYREFDAIEIVGPFNVVNPLVDEMVTQIIDENKKNIVFNLQKTTYMTSPGVATIIKAIKRFQAVKGTIYIVGATPDIKDLLVMSRIDGFVRFL